MGYCAKCGKPYGQGAAFCQGCGAALSPGAAAAAPPPQPQARRELRGSQRLMIVAIAAIVAVAIIAVAAFPLLKSAGLNGKSLSAFVKQYEGTWTDQNGDKAVIDTTGGIARISIVRGSDGSLLGSGQIDGNTVTISDANGEQVFSATIDGANISAGYSQSGTHLSLDKNELVVSNPNSGETYTFVRH
jgi:hypothetical protein